jgi:hypothetical protein
MPFLKRFAMRIGLDFDNTIVSYDELFHKVAVEGGHVPANTVRSKLAVRDHLRATGREQVWIEMQGYVYGARMAEAAPFPGVIEVLHRLNEAGIECGIVSHKTRHPFAGPAYDLHQVARNWIDASLVYNGKPLIPESRVFFELTKDEKIARIGACGFTLFVDDLAEILTHPGFPAGTLPVLFDPAGSESLPPGARRVASWAALEEMLDGLRCATR